MLSKNIVVVLMVVLGFVAQQCFANPEWKTYLNPIYKFSFDYPFSNITSIKETENYDVIVGDSDRAESLFRLELIHKNYPQDLESIVDTYKNRTLSYKDLNYSIFEDTKSINYHQANLTGYQYIVFSKDSDLMSKETFLTNDRLEYILFFDSSLSRYEYTNNSWIDRTINSIKFLE